MKKWKQRLTTNRGQQKKITFDAGYNNERMQAWLYLPKGFKPPYQTVVFFPGSGDIYSKIYDPLSINFPVIDFIVKSGRARHAAHLQRHF